MIFLLFICINFFSIVRNRMSVFEFSFVLVCSNSMFLCAQCSCQLLCFFVQFLCLFFVCFVFSWGVFLCSVDSSVFLCSIDSCVFLCSCFGVFLCSVLVFCIQCPCASSLIISVIVCFALRNSVIVCFTLNSCVQLRYIPD